MCIERRSRLEFGRFGHDEEIVDDQSEAAPQHEKIRIEFNQDSFKTIPNVTDDALHNERGFTAPR